MGGTVAQQFGSLVNMVTGGAKQGKEPEVGMGATICMWSDRNPATVAQVLRFKTGKRAGEIKGVTIKADRAILVSGNEGDGSASYRYERDDAAPEATYLKNSRGQYQRKGGGDFLALGRRERYYDPHF